jgi:hypothetical protein
MEYGRQRYDCARRHLLIEKTFWACANDGRCQFLTNRETPDSCERADRYLRLMDAGDAVAHYLAEWYLPELTEQSVDDIVAKLDIAATTASDEGTPVRLLVTLAVPTDEVLYGVFHAYSPEIVTRTCQRAGFPHQRLSGDVGARIRHGPPAMGCVGRTAAEPEPTVG